MDNFEKLKQIFVRVCREVSENAIENGNNIQFEVSEDTERCNTTNLSLVKLSLETPPKTLRALNISFDDAAKTVSHPTDNNYIKVCDSDGALMEEMKSVIYAFVKEASYISDLPEETVMTMLDNLDLDRRTQLFADTLGL